MFAILSPLQRILLPFSNIITYLEKTFVPMNYSPIYPLQGEARMVLSFALFVLITIVVLLATRKGSSVPLATWATFLILVFPSSVAVQAVMQTTADRYTYLPSVVLSVAAGTGIADVLSRLRRASEQRTMMAALLVVAAFLAFLTGRQQKVWTNSETLWNRAIALYPTMPLPHNNLGLALQTRGELSRAKQEYARAIELKPDYVEAYVNLGNVLFTEMKWKEAERLFHRAAELAPRRGEVYNNLGILANAQGNSLDALYWLRKSVEVDSTYAQGYFNLGALYARMGNTAAAIEALQQAARLGHREAQVSLTQQGVSR
jgi:tetratricopeptide (TPR) repeat protein